MKKTDDRKDFVSIPLMGDESVSGIIQIPTSFVPGAGTAIILAHGAGKDMESPFILAFAERLTCAGVLTMRFNFPYKEKGKKFPDPQHKLEASWRSAFEFLKDNPKYAPKRIFAAGKSMGGRIASNLAARRELPVRGLIFYGYPLHAPGKMGKLRDTHLYSINVPMLFFAGTRDPLCNLEKLRQVLDRITSPWELVVVDGGEHSFKVLKSLGKTQTEIYEFMTRKTLAWITQK